MRLEKFDGPYENWFLKNGKQFTFGDAPLPDFMKMGTGGQNDTVWTAMLERTGPDMSWVYDETSTKVSVRPMIFEPLATNGDDTELHYSFIPVLVSDNKNPSEGGMPPDSDFRFALNFPLSRSLVTEAYVPGAVPANWTTDGVVTDQLAKLPSTTKKTLTVVAVIDDGLAFAHKNFRDDLKTRIEFCWLQSGVTRALPGTATTDSVPVGRELTRDDINAALLRHRGDEDAVYNDPQMGAVSLNPDLGTNINKPFTHGTHVMDTACGIGPGDWQPQGEAEGDLSLMRTIGVQLPRNPLRDTAGFGKDIYILAALHYIIARTKLLKERYGAERVNLLVNLSLGTTGGPHDGTHQLEAAIDELVTKRRNTEDGVTLVAIPAANSFADRMHAVVSAADHDANNNYSLTWSIQPNDFTSSYVELWFRHEASQRPSGARDFFQECAIQFKSPDGVIDVALNSGGGTKTQYHEAINTASGETIGQIGVERYRGGDWRCVICLGPTEFRERIKLPSSGRWSITIKRKSAATFSHVDAYILRDEDPADTANGARQSYFYDRAYRTHDDEGRAYGMAGIEDEQVVRRHGSLNGWATQMAPTLEKTRIAVAGYVGLPDGDGLKLGKPLKPAFYSSAGKKDGSRPSVDLSNHSDRSQLIAGVRAQGTRSGSTAYLMGTSAAAPQFIRQLATDLIDGLRNSSVPSTDCFIEDPKTVARLGKSYNQNGRSEPPNPCHGLAASFQQTGAPPTS